MNNGDLTPRHPIRVVAKRTGLTPAVLRAWEKRYGVVDPFRTEGGHRLYSDSEVNRLTLLRKVVEEGRSISQVATLSVGELVGLVREDSERRYASGVPEPLVGATPTDLLNRAVKAVYDMNPRALERILTRAAIALPVPTVTDEIVSPLLADLGISWSKGLIAPAQEHLASVVIRRFLDWLLTTVEVGPGRPVLLSGTPAGERHEFGALLTAVTGAAEGWKSEYLGPDLPAEEIARAAVRLEAEVVGLSLVEPAGVSQALGEIRVLRARLPPDVHLVIGGPVAVDNAEEWTETDVEVLLDLEELRDRLRYWSTMI